MEWFTLTTQADAATIGEMKVLKGYGATVRELRGGKSQADLAASAGVDVKTISNVEREATRPRIDVLDAILSALNVSIVDFAVAVAGRQGGGVAEVAQALHRDRIQREFAAGTMSTLTATDDLERRKLQDRIDDLEARLYGQSAARRAASKEGPDKR